MASFFSSFTFFLFFKPISLSHASFFLHSSPSPSSPHCLYRFNSDISTFSLRHLSLPLSPFFLFHCLSPASIFIPIFIHSYSLYILICTVSSLSFPLLPLRSSFLSLFHFSFLFFFLNPSYLLPILSSVIISLILLY